MRIAANANPLELVHWKDELRIDGRYRLHFANVKKHLRNIKAQKIWQDGFLCSKENH